MGFSKKLAMTAIVRTTVSFWGTRLDIAEEEVVFAFNRSRVNNDNKENNLKQKSEGNYGENKIQQNGNNRAGSRYSGGGRVYLLRLPALSGTGDADKPNDQRDC